MKIQANTYDAEMARTGGGMFNTLMKSGTNDYHGSAYGHVRRTDWDANASSAMRPEFPSPSNPTLPGARASAANIGSPSLRRKEQDLLLPGNRALRRQVVGLLELQPAHSRGTRGNFSNSFDSRRGPLHVIYDPLTGNSIPGKRHSRPPELRRWAPGDRQYLPDSGYDSAYYGASDDCAVLFDQSSRSSIYSQSR